MLCEWGVKISSHSRAIGYGRRLLQEAKSYCAWKDGACSLAAEGATELLKDSTSRMSAYIRALFVSCQLPISLGLQLPCPAWILGLISAWRVSMGQQQQQR